MSKFYEFTPDQQHDWDEWLASRPEGIRNLALNFPPNRLFLLKSTGQKVSPTSYNESGTITVLVSGDFNLVSFERRVFGIAPEDLEECDIPKEPAGVLFTQEEEINRIMDELRKTECGSATKQPEITPKEFLCAELQKKGLSLKDCNEVWDALEAYCDDIAKSQFAVLIFNGGEGKVAGIDFEK